MKILYIEDALDGHHASYLHGLTDTDRYECTVITPQYNAMIPARQLVSNVAFPIRKLRDYLRWMSFIVSETKREKYDIVHFLDGDSIMRFFGVGFGFLHAKKVLITFHGFYSGMLRTISYRQMCKNRIAVVHTKIILEKMKNLGIASVEQVTYPSFFTHQERCKNNNQQKVLGALGATRKDKGLDLLLQALESVVQPYKLLIAGAPTGFSEEDINRMKANLSGEIICDLRYLTDEEYEECLNMVDIIVIPYRLRFNGASGPLSEGAARGKMIIGPKHGSLGQIITEHHLGLTFESEDVNDLAKILNCALSNDFVFDDIARQYQHQLTPAGFREKYLGIYNKVIR